MANEFGDEEVSVNEFGDRETAPQTNLLSKEGITSLGKTIVPSIKQGLLGLQLFHQQNPESNVVGKPIVKLPGRPMAPTPEDIAQTQAEIAANAEEIRKATPENQSYPLKIARGATQSIVQNVPGLVASVATRNPIPAMVSGAEMSKGQSMAETNTPNEFGDLPDVSPETATLNARIHAGLEGGLELIPMGGLLKDLPKETFGKTAAKFLAKEEATEIATTIGQTTSDKVLVKPEQSLNEFGDELLSNVVDTAVTTPFAAGGTVAIASGQERLQNAYAERRAMKLQAELDAVKRDGLADLQQRAVEAAQGVDDELAVAMKLEGGPAHADVPDAPLTPEQEELAKVQLRNKKLGADVLPDDPEALADVADLDTLLSDPAYKQPDAIARDVEDHIQADMDRGMSREVAERRALEAFPNQQPATKRAIAWSSSPEQVGLSLSKTKVAPDSVVVVGGNEDQFSSAYVSALGSTIQQWSAKWLPQGARVVVNLSGLTGEAVGGYQQSANGLHIITPRELVRSERAEQQTKDGVALGRMPGTGYNAFTQQQTFGAITHEFGHALTMAAFAMNMPAEHRNVVGRLDTGAVYSEQELAAMPAPEAAVIRDYQALKQAVLSGKMSAEELVERWLGTWKLGKDLMKRDRRTLYSHANEVLLREAKRTGDSRLSSTPLNLIPARTLIHALGRNSNVPDEQSNAAAESYYLQFNEFMAEQFSRYAHANKIDEGTALGVYFKKALQSLREFFKMLKSTKGVEGTALVKPGVSFQEWVDGLAEAKAVALAKKAQKKPRKPRTKKEKVKKPVEERVKEVIAEVKAQEEAAEEGRAITELEELAEDPAAKELLKDRVRQAFPDPRDETRADIMKLIARGRLLDAEDMLIDAVKSQLKKDVKEAGGNWSPIVVSEFTVYLKSGPANKWLKTAILRYMNKHLGTATDPIKNVLLPKGEEFVTWESQTVPFIETKVWTARDGAIAMTNPALSELSQHIRIGDPVHDFNSSEEGVAAIYALTDYINHVGDYMSQHVDPAKYGQYDFVRAVKETVKQDEAQKKKMETTEGQLEGTVKFYPFPDGFQWVRVESPQALKNEGDAMGHCVGGYCNAVQEGRTVIYSLRDPKGKPHVTIEVAPETTKDDIWEPSILQIKGKQNLAPNKQYWPYVHELLHQFEWGTVDELNNVGLTSFADHPIFKSAYAMGITLEQSQALMQHIKDTLGDQRFYEEEAFTQIVMTWLKNRPMLDVDSTQEQSEIAKALQGIGEGKQSTFWQRAVDFAKRAQHYVLQIQQLSHGTDDVGLETFIGNQNRMMALKNNLLKNGTEIAERWENLSKHDAGLVEKVLMDEFHSEGHSTVLEQDPATGKWKHRAGEAFQKFLAARGIDGTKPEGAELAQLILDIKNSFLEHIQVIEDTAIQAVKEQYRTNDLIVQKRSFEIREMARSWRNMPYVPQGHYGNFVVKVFEKDEDGKRVLAYQGHFESAAEQDAAVKKLQKVVHPDDLRWMKIDDTVGPQLILPKDFLETLADTGEFTSGQLEAVADAMTPIRSQKAFSKLARDASRIAGASPDILRNYANWIEDSANFTSKLAFGRRLTKSRAWTRSDMNELMREGRVEEAREKQRLLDTMTKAQQFIMHPEAEWHQARSAIALTYLMWAPKTALMNATGLFQTWAAVTADYGEFEGNALMAGAAKDLVSGNLTEDEHWAKNQALEDGLIDQGFGYFMSGLANAGNLARRVRPTMLGKAGRAFVDLGMYPFKAVETGNRNLTLIALYRAERGRLLKRGEDVDVARRVAYEAASRKTRLLQNDYASGNRPELLRGKKSLFMIFLSYPQYMLWIMSGGYERGVRQDAIRHGETPRSRFGGMTMRMWLVFLAMSGLEGVPFGEALGDLLQKMWQMYGKGENIRLEGQRFLKETAGIESVYWRKVIQRGFLHDVLGVDLSGSYSLGKPLPGLGLIDSRARNWQEFVGEAFEDLAGPFGGVTKGAIGLGLSEDIGAKELGQNLPGAAGAIARAVKAGQDGLKTNKGERILRDSQGKLREPTASEVALIGTGFRLSEVARFQELEALKRQQADYWNGRRLGLKKSYLKALEERDPAVREDVNKAIAEYNAQIPHRNLRLSGKELREFTRNSARRVRRLEQDRDPRRVSGLNRDIAKVLSD